mmetsp:Transcript_16263/g.35155  ORF Transcript_16263/g.35155 Transcript_16263/m.35155 type:complete len:80 (-) Transcript_16263:242-481(-)
MAISLIKLFHNYKPIGTNASAYPPMTPSTSTTTGPSLFPLPSSPTGPRLSSQLQTSNKAIGVESTARLPPSTFGTTHAK